MSNKIDEEKLFAFTIASVKDIQDIVKEAIDRDFIHFALELLEEEKQALNEALTLLSKIDSDKYQEVFGDMIPKKLKDIAFAVSFCNNKLIEGNYVFPTQDQEYRLKKKKQEIKIKSLRKLKAIAHKTNEWALVNMIDAEIERAELNRYQA
jgi:hypothetical protein